MNEKLDLMTKGSVMVPAAAAQVTFPKWWPWIDTASEAAATLIPIIGLATGVIYLCVAAVNLWMKIKKARGLTHADD